LTLKIRLCAKGQKVQNLAFEALWFVHWTPRTRTTYPVKYLSYRLSESAEIWRVSFLRGDVVGAQWLKSSCNMADGVGLSSKFIPQVTTRLVLYTGAERLACCSRLKAHVQSASLLTNNCGHRRRGDVDTTSHRTSDVTQ